MVRESRKWENHNEETQGQTCTLTLTVIYYVTFTSSLGKLTKAMTMKAHFTTALQHILLHPWNLHHQCSYHTLNHNQSFKVNCIEIEKHACDSVMLLGEYGEVDCVQHGSNSSESASKF